jgi:hypothetical protein
MLRFLAVLFGIAFIFAGVAGYLPMFQINDLLFGYFEVNNVHNVIHLVTGVLAIMAATSHVSAKFFFKLFGLVYAAIGIWGFWQSGDLIIMHMNLNDNILHVVVGVIALYLGFVTSRKEG